MSALSWKLLAVVLCAYIIVAYARPQAPEQPEPVIVKMLGTFVCSALNKTFEENGIQSFIGGNEITYMSAELWQQSDVKNNNYEYQYEVRDPEKELFFNKNEAGDAQGKVSGQYSVWLPDGRLMTVAYSVDGENGFVPKVTFDTNNPLG